MKTLIVMMLLAVPAFAQAPTGRRLYCIKKIAPDFRLCVNVCMTDPRNSETPKIGDCKFLCGETLNPDLFRCLDGEG